MEKKSRGRPVHSEIRQNIIDLLYYMKSAYGYEIYKNYVDLFPKVTMRSIYYHLGKGVSLHEIKVDKVKKEKGDYSWGTDAQKTYYALGDKAQPRENIKIKEYFSKKK